MEIRKPKFELGQKVIDKKGHVGNVTKVDSYHFDEEEYWYDVNCDEIISGFYTESYLDPYVEKPNSVWGLQKDDTYYAIDYGDMNVFSLVFCNDEYDLNNRALGNCFLTKEEAEFEIERRKIEMEMLRLGGRRYLKLLKENYCFCFDSEFSSISCECFSCLGICSSIYFDSEKEALKALNTIGKDRIKKYIFGVNE